jgi:predicted Zn-dependent peptidase
MMVELASRHFGGLRHSNMHSTEPVVYGGGGREQSDDVEQVHMVVGFDGVGYEDPDYYTVQLLSNALGGGMSSRLFQEVREKRGLAYSIYSFGSSFIDGGLFGVYAGCAEEDANEVGDLIADELVRVRQGITGPELERARTQLKAGLLMSRESTSSRCETAARQMLVFGRPVPQDEVVAKLDAVDGEQVRRCAERLFMSARPTLAAIGPESGVHHYDRIAGRFA